jgi:hypothetical protein
MLSQYPAPAEIPQFSDIAGGYIEEGFCEHIKTALSEMEKQSAKHTVISTGLNSAPGCFGKSLESNPGGKDGEKVSANYLPDITKLPKTSSQSWLIDEEEAANPFEIAAMLMNPQVLEIRIPEMEAQLAVIRTAEETPETPDFKKPEAPKTPENQPPTPLISEMQAPESPRITANPESGESYEVTQTPQDGIIINPEVVQTPITTAAPEALNSAEIPTRTIEFVQQEELKTLSTGHGNRETRDIHYGKATAESAVGERSATEQALKASENVRVTTESQGKTAKQNQAQTLPEPQSESVLKAWETLPKAKVNLVEKPQELNELLENAKAENTDNTEETAANEIPNPLLQTNQATPKPIVVNAQEMILPQSQTNRIGEEIIARLTTAKNGTVTFEMVLNPVSLGKITVKLVAGAAGTAVEITAENGKTAQLLQNCADRIGAILDKSDARLESFVVNVENKPDYSEQRENQNQNRGSYESGEQADDEDESEQGISFSELLREM